MSGGRSPRRKGDDRERQIVALHLALGVKAERVPLSGATRYQGNGADIDIYACGPEVAPLVCEVKARAAQTKTSDPKATGGFKLLERWLGENDALFLRRDRQEPLVVLPWRSWERLLKALGHRPPEPPRAARIEPVDRVTEALLP